MQSNNDAQADKGVTLQRPVLNTQTTTRREIQKYGFSGMCHIYVELAYDFAHRSRTIDGARKVNRQLREGGREVYADTGFQRSSDKSRMISQSLQVAAFTVQLECVNPGITAQIEQPCRMVKHPFGHIKVRFPRLPTRKALPPNTVFALVKLRLSRCILGGLVAPVRLRFADAIPSMRYSVWMTCELI